MPRTPLTYKGLELNRFQVEAVRSIEKDHSILLSAPTGAGKTLVAEYAIEQALRAGRRCVYTAPIKALSNQKYRDFRDHPSIDVGLMTGDVTIHPEAPLLIMTTEIFRNTLFEAPERFEDIAYLIFDEIHYLDDSERGTVWEESLIFAPEGIRFICLSATIQNLESFGDWIRSVHTHELDVIRYEKRPVPLSHRLYHGKFRSFRLSQVPSVQKRFQEQIRREEQERDEHHHRGGRRHGRGRQNGPQGRGRGRGRRNDRISPHQSARWLLDDLCKEQLTPILFFCFSRRECEIKAERNAFRKLLDNGERRKIQRLFDKICDLYQLDWEEDLELDLIRDRALKGIGYHHAGMLPIHKEVVERLFTSGLLKLLFTTETFALGINMPARTVVFASLRKFDGVDFDYMKTRDYLQMAGRAGRQGIDKDGLVFSILDNEDLMEAPLRRVLEGEPEPVQSRFNLSYSTIMNLYERMGRSLVTAYEKSFSYFQIRGSRKKREILRSQASAAILRKIHLLEEAAYLDPKDGVIARGQIARQINGYEIQLTELLFQGVLDGLDASELAAVFASIVYEERRGSQCLVRPNKRSRSIGKEVDAAIRRFTAIEVRNGFDRTIKQADFGLYPAVHAWAGGCDFDDFAHFTTCSAGDIVRTLRMAVQMLRQLQSAISTDYPLHDELELARIQINRDVVDAKKQLELG